MLIIMKAYVSGLLLCTAIGAVSLFLSNYIPLGSVTLAIILGTVSGNLFKPGSVYDKGIRFSEKKILAIAIGLMGINLDFTILRELSYQSLLTVVLAMIVTIGSALILSRFLDINRKLALLLGIGNGVCGSSAIAATEHIIGAQEKEAGLSIAIVNFLGTLGIFLVPFIASFLLKTDDTGAGFLIGNTLQAVGQVAAAGFSLGDKAGQAAMIVKMSRILMLVPLIFILHFAFGYKGRSHKGEKKRGFPVPLFILGFVFFAAISSSGLLSQSAVSLIASLSQYGLLIAMSAIGLKITFGDILKNGKNALLTGALVFFVQIIFSGAAVLLYI